jgi:hypothetical protein
MAGHTDALQDAIRLNYEKTVELSNHIAKFDKLYTEFKFSALVSQAFEDCTPDMYWAKDIYGKYVIANKTLRDNLLFDEKPYGKTDIQLAMIQKHRMGEENFTFGDICGRSDDVVLSEERPMRFVEWGVVNGNMLILEIHKNVMRDFSGNIIGTVGIGRDITEDYYSLHGIADATTCDTTRYEILKLLEKYTFENKDVHE